MLPKNIQLEGTSILVTGAAGFIGSNLVKRLFKEMKSGCVVGLDNMNHYYDVSLKEYRVREIEGQERKEVDWHFVRGSIADRELVNQLFADYKFDIVVNLAAQAGVRYSITNPYAYLHSNLEGFLNILEACRNFKVRHLVYASSSSVYGLNTKVPFSEEDKADSPVSLYGATKKANELMAHSYSKLYGFATTGLRFFTVYGPWGRPDMSPMLFATAISKGEPIKVFNGGDMVRDFTYVDDIVEGTIRVIDNPPVVRQAHQPVPEPVEGPSAVPFKVYNIGCSHPVKLMDFIGEIENALGVEAKKEFLPMQQGDVYQTFADCSNLESELGYHPSTTLHEGIGRFIEWFKSVYTLKENQDV